MKRNLIRYAVVAALISFVPACGGKKKSEISIRCADFLPSNLDEIGARRGGDARTFAGDSLFEYIDGGAELYHSYHFVEVATADYRKGNVEMVVDIYRFDNADHAYGLYASHRPDRPDFVKLGAEGFKTPTSIDFVKGPFTVRVVAFEESELAAQAVLALASEIDSSLPGDNSLPATFSQFPAGAAVEATDMIYGESFLGQPFLTDVYSRKYVIDGDTLTLFISVDNAGDKFVRWFEVGAADGSAQPGPAEIPYDDGRDFVVDNSYYGRIMVGLKNGKLAGMVNYDDSRKEFLSEWLLSLP